MDSLSQFDATLEQAMGTLPPRAGRPPFVPRAASVAGLNAKRLNAALDLIEALRGHIKALPVPSRWPQRAALEADIGLAEMMLETRQREARVFTTAEAEART